MIHGRSVVVLLWDPGVISIGNTSLLKSELKLVFVINLTVKLRRINTLRLIISKIMTCYHVKKAQALILLLLMRSKSGL